MAETIKILLIEDNPGDARLVKEMLKNDDQFKIDLIVADRLNDGLKIIATDLIHIIILDLNLPESKGIETFKKVAKYSLNIPIIILSVLSSKELIYEAMLCGAQDYLIKGEIGDETLLRAVRYAMWRYRPELIK